MSKHAVSNEGGVMVAESRKTRRAALRALLGASGLAIPVISASASALRDPIFTAIARHKTACEARNFMDDLIYAPGRDVSRAEWDAWERAHDNDDAAFDELCTIAPKTAAGMRAIIAHLISIDDGRLSHKIKKLLAIFLKSPLLDHLVD